MPVISPSAALPLLKLATKFSEYLDSLPKDDEQEPLQQR